MSILPISVRVRVLSMLYFPSLPALLYPLVPPPPLSLSLSLSPILSSFPFLLPHKPVAANCTQSPTVVGLLVYLLQFITVTVFVPLSSLSLSLSLPLPLSLSLSLSLSLLLFTFYFLLYYLLFIDLFLNLGLHNQKI